MNEYLKIDFNEFIDYCVGRLVIAIGKGDFRNEVALIVMMAHKRAAEIGK